MIRVRSGGIHEVTIRSRSTTDMTIVVVEDQVRGILPSSREALIIMLIKKRESGCRGQVRVEHGGVQALAGGVIEDVDALCGRIDAVIGVYPIAVEGLE